MGTFECIYPARCKDCDFCKERLDKIGFGEPHHYCQILLNANWKQPEKSFVRLRDRACKHFILK